MLAITVEGILLTTVHLQYYMYSINNFVYLYSLTYGSRLN